MNLIDKDALIESLGIETVCDECEHERLKYHCGLDPVEACTRIIEAPVISVTTESAEKAIEVLKNAAWLGAVYSFEETEEAVKTVITALQMAQTQSDHIADISKKGDLISRKAVFYALECMRFASDAERRYAFSMLEQIPIAQSEIIRCKDCNYYFYDANFAKSWCNRMSGTFMVKPDSYCSFAVKRKENR